MARCDHSLDRRLMLNVGALAAAIGLGVATWQLAFYNSRDYASGAPFVAVLVVCLAVLVWTFLGRSATRRVLRRVAALAMPLVLVGGLRAPYKDTKLAAYLASMRSDLRSLAEKERQVLADSGHYTSQVGDFETSTGVTLDSIVREGAGWAATARHRGTARVCAIFVDQSPLPPAFAPGEPACVLPPFPVTPLGIAFTLVALGLATATAGARATSDRAT